MRYDALIFDSDGVFVEPTDRRLIREGVQHALESLGVDVDFDVDVDVDGDQFHPHVDALAGATEPAAVERVSDALGIEADTLWRSREESVSTRQRRALETGAKPAYDDIDAVRDLSAMVDGRVGVVSNNQHATVKAVLTTTGLEAYVQRVAGREPTLAGLDRLKPNPYYFDAVRADLEASNPLYVGDSLADIELAERVGVDVVFLDRSHTDSLGPRATYTVDSLSDIVTQITD